MAVHLSYPLTYKTRVEIISIGFEGPNRAGKGTQCALMRDWLAERGIPSLIVRGDGSRTGSGERPEDPPSPWWQAANRRLHDLHELLVDYEEWNRAAYRLARELVVWRDRVLPGLVRAQGQRLGVLLVDRSLLSRTMIPRAMGAADVTGALYAERYRTKGRRVSPELVCPDLIVNLTAPRRALVSRLDPGDPKFEFRKRLIEETCDWFGDAVTYIPRHLRSRVVKVDASEEAERVFRRVVSLVQIHFESLWRLDRSPVSQPAVPVLRCAPEMGPDWQGQQIVGERQM
jgi:thymidylate kinase